MIDRFMSNNDWAQEHTRMWRYCHGPGTIYHFVSNKTEPFELVVDGNYSRFSSLEEAVKVHKVMTRLETPT